MMYLIRNAKYIHMYVVSFGALITELMKRNQVKMLLHMIESKAHSVCAKCRYIFAKWMLFATARKKTCWTWLTWYEYIYTKTELICHPNRRHTFAKLIKNRMKFKMQFTWLHLFLLLNSVFVFFLLFSMNERASYVFLTYYQHAIAIFNCPFYKYQRQTCRIVYITTNMPNEPYNNVKMLSLKSWSFSFAKSSNYNEHIFILSARIIKSRF